MIKAAKLGNYTDYQPELQTDSNVFEGSLIMKDYKITQNIRTLDKKGQDVALNRKARKFEDMLYEQSRTQKQSKNQLFLKTKPKPNKSWKKYESQKYVQKEEQKKRKESIKKMNSLDADPKFLCFETIREEEELGVNYNEVDFTPLNDLDFTTNVRRLSRAIESMDLKTRDMNSFETNTETSESDFL